MSSLRRHCGRSVYKIEKKMVVSDDQFNCGNFSSTEEVSSFRFADLYLRFLFKMRKKKKKDFERSSRIGHGMGFSAHMPSCQNKVLHECSHVINTEHSIKLEFNLIKSN